MACDQPIACERTVSPDGSVQGPTGSGARAVATPIRSSAPHGSTSPERKPGRGGAQNGTHHPVSARTWVARGRAAHQGRLCRGAGSCPLPRAVARHRRPSGQASHGFRPGRDCDPRYCRVGHPKHQTTEPRSADRRGPESRAGLGSHSGGCASRADQRLRRRCESAHEEERAPHRRQRLAPGTPGRGFRVALESPADRGSTQGRRDRRGDRPAPPHRRIGELGQRP